MSPLTTTATRLLAFRTVVVDGNLVSSRKPDDLPAFMREMIGVAAHAATPT